MVFSNEHKILTKNVSVKGYNERQLRADFPDKE